MRAPRLHCRLRNVLAVVAISAACTSEGDPTAPSSLGGAWQFSLSVANAAAGVSCAASGPLTLTVTGSTIAGVGSFPRTCTGSQIPVVVSHSFSGELLDDSTLQWHDAAGCGYTGRRIAADRLEGDAVCTVPWDGHESTVMGTWVATR